MARLSLSTWEYFSRQAIEFVKCSWILLQLVLPRPVSLLHVLCLRSQCFLVHLSFFLCLHPNRLSPLLWSLPSFRSFSLYFLFWFSFCLLIDADHHLLYTCLFLSCLSIIAYTSFWLHSSLGILSLNLKSKVLHLILFLFLLAACSTTVTLLMS